MENCVARSADLANEREARRGGGGVPFVTRKGGFGENLTSELEHSKGGATRKGGSSEGKKPKKAGRTSWVVKDTVAAGSKLRSPHNRMKAILFCRIMLELKKNNLGRALGRKNCERFCKSLT